MRQWALRKLKFDEKSYKDATIRRCWIVRGFKWHSCGRESEKIAEISALKWENLKLQLSSLPGKIVSTNSPSPTAFVFAEGISFVTVSLLVAWAFDCVTFPSMFSSFVRLINGTTRAEDKEQFLWHFYTSENLEYFPNESPTIREQIYGGATKNQKIWTFIIIFHSKLLFTKTIFHFSQVSWIRKRDLHILTTGPSSYTSDQRFQVNMNDWQVVLIVLSLCLPSHHHRLWEGFIAVALIFT